MGDLETKVEELKAALDEKGTYIRDLEQTLENANKELRNAGIQA